MPKQKAATDTSTCDTSPSIRKKRVSTANDEKKPVQFRVQPFIDRENVTHDDVAIACRSFGFRPQRRVLPFLQVVRRLGLKVNAVLNDALVFYFDAYAEGEGLRDEVRLAQLQKEERELVQLNRVMLRSGAYLHGYAAKVLKGGLGNPEDTKAGRKPLATLAKEEEPIFKRMVARPEAIVREILEILDRRLPRKDYVLQEDRPLKRRRRPRLRNKQRRASIKQQERRCSQNLELER